MRDFKSYAKIRDMQECVDFSFATLSNNGINPVLFFESIFDNPEMLNQEPAEVINEFWGNFSRNLKSAWSGLTAAGKMKALKDQWQQLKRFQTQSPERFAAMGYSQASLDKLNRLYQQEKENNKKGFWGKLNAERAEIAKERAAAAAKAKEDKFHAGLRKTLGMDEPEEMGEPTASTTQQQQPQQQQPEQPSIPVRGPGLRRDLPAWMQSTAPSQSGRVAATNVQGDISDVDEEQAKNFVVGRLNDVERIAGPGNWGNVQKMLQDIMIYLQGNGLASKL